MFAYRNDAVAINLKVIHGYLLTPYYTIIVKHIAEDDSQMTLRLGCFNPFIVDSVAKKQY